MHGDRVRLCESLPSEELRLTRLYDRAGLDVGVPAELLDLYAEGRLDASNLVASTDAE
jgi:hypothetical protein